MKTPQTNAKTFSEVFSKSQPYVSGAKGFTRKWGKNNVGGYCMVTKAGKGYHKAFNALPNDKVMHAIDQSMLQIDNDSIYFEIIIFDDGYATVYAKYNQILGDRLIAVIDANSIP